MSYPAALTLAVCALAANAHAQHRVWYIDAPAAGPFGDNIAIVGDRSGHRYSDIVRDVYVPIYQGSTTLTAVGWTFAGNGGMPIAQGVGAFSMATAGDANGDGLGDYLTPVQGLILPQCGGPCRALGAISGLDGSTIWRADFPPANMFGHMLQGDLDLDGDGRPDALIGTNQGGGGILYAVANGGQILYQINGTQIEPFGPGLGKFIDYNGDGCDDFLLGIYAQPDGAIDIRSGLDGSLLRRLIAPTAIWGYGATAHMIGDLDGDNIPDVLAGDSGPFTPGVVAAIGSVSGAMLFRWQVNTLYSGDFGWPAVAAADVDRDGFEDLIATANNGNVGQYVFSGRDGSLIEHYTEPTGAVTSRVVAMPPQPADPFPRWVAHGASTSVTRTYLFSGAPNGVERTGYAGRGRLNKLPVLGLRELRPSGFRVTLANAEPGTNAILVLGFSQPTVPAIDLNLFGFAGCTLYPSPDVAGFFVTGTTWPSAGYVAHDLPQDLVDAGTPGSYQAFLQWIVLGQGPTWPGGVSEAMRIHVR